MTFLYNRNVGIPDRRVKKQIGDVPTMRKKTLLALLLALMMLMSGCALVTVNEEKDNAQVIVDVDGETVDKLTFTNNVYALVNSDQTMQLYYTYGMMDYVYQTVAQQYIQNFVMKHEAIAQGLDNLSEEDMQEVEENAVAQYNSFMDAIAEAYLPTSELEGDALREAAAQYVQEHGIVTAAGLATLDDFREYVKADMPAHKLQHSVVDAVTVSAEDVQAAMEEQEYRLVKHILVGYGDEGSVADAQAALALAETTAKAAQDNLNSAADADKAALQTTLDNANASLEAAKAAVTAAQERFQKVQEIYALATAEDADFDALIAEYGEDPGMTSNPDGYVIFKDNTDYVAEFKEGSMALEKVGDVSDIVETSYGYHIIQFAADASSESSAMAAARASVENDMLSQAQNDALTAAYDTWVAKANVKTYLERLN